ncbi:MAG: phage holin family protein [Eubacterium sp.]|nr:phage holin family protein [Eubacterium sp.]
MSKINVFTDRYNVIAGGIVAVLTAVFGTYWYVFAAFLVLNVIDWITGWVKANKKKEESSKVGAIGAVKKLGYWAMVLVAFLIASVFVHFGHDMLGLDLSFLHLIGWWVLAMLIVNEARSILENLVELGYKVPEVLIKGLAVTEKLIEAGIDILGADDEKESQDGADNVTDR